MPKGDKAEQSQPKIATPDEWRNASSGRWLATLPSGMTVKVKRLDIALLLAQEVISADQFIELSTPGKGKESFDRRVDLARIIACHVVVEPPVVDTGGGSAPLEAVGSHEVPAMDVLAILAWVITGQSGMIDLVQIE